MLQVCANTEMENDLVARHRKFSGAEPAPEVLVASQSRPARHKLSAAFAAMGYQVAAIHLDHLVLNHVGAGHQQSQFREVQSEVLVLDIRGNPWFGLGLLEMVRLSNWRIRVLLLVDAADATNLAQRGRDLGANAVFQLPCSLNTIVQAARRVAPLRSYRRPFRPGEREQLQA